MGSLDMVGKCLNDLQLHGVEAVNMMKLSGAWCLQADYTRRPPVSTVLKVFRGSYGSGRRHRLRLMDASC